MYGHTVNAARKLDFIDIKDEAGHILNNYLLVMDLLHSRQNFNNLEIVQFIATALKSIPKLVEMQSLGAKCCKIQHETC